MVPPSPATRLRLGFAGAIERAPHHLSVDGMTDRGPNLSHWPGNRTPPQWKADLSTEIALRFAAADHAEQAGFLNCAEVVLNDHYDTDGFGALLAVLRPDVAREHEDVMRAAAATGDFGTWQTWRGFAIDRAVAHLASPASPAHAAFAGITGDAELSLARYRWLLDHATELLGHPESFCGVYADEMARVRSEIDQGLRGAIVRRIFADLGLSILTSRGATHRMTLNTLAGAFRVLHVQERPDGPRYRFHDRTESWFELVSIPVLPRRDLRPLAARLDALEPERDGARWNADPPSEPIPELYFGVPAEQAYGAITRELRPSRLAPARVVAELAGPFAVATSRAP
jgi:hypothetical protein